MAAGQGAPAVHDEAGRARIADGDRLAAALAPGSARFFSLLFAVGHDLRIAVGADLTSVRAARERLELLARPVVLTVVTEFEGSRYAHWSLCSNRLMRGGARTSV